MMKNNFNDKEFDDKNDDINDKAILMVSYLLIR